MKKYFQILLEFNRETINQTIVQAVSDNQKGYVCVVDGNVLATSVKNPQYRDIINNAMVNTCDGSSIALLAGIVNREKLGTYTGPELFKYFTKEPFKQLFLGNTVEINQRLKLKFKGKSMAIEQMFFETLPFKHVDEFDYNSIAEKINKLSPDIIWVSLGAPKQELFISKLYPLVNKGVLIAIGAAFNLYLNESKNKRAPSLFLKYKLEWLYRSLNDPKRIGKRALNYALLLPSIILNEIQIKYFSKHKIS